MRARNLPSFPIFRLDAASARLSQDATARLRAMVAIRRQVDGRHKRRSGDCGSLELVPRHSGPCKSLLGACRNKRHRYRSSDGQRERAPCRMPLRRTDQGQEGTKRVIIVPNQGCFPSRRLVWFAGGWVRPIARASRFRPLRRAGPQRPSRHMVPAAFSGARRASLGGRRLAFRNGAQRARRQPHRTEHWRRNSLG